VAAYAAHVHAHGACIPRALTLLLTLQTHIARRWRLVLRLSEVEMAKTVFVITAKGKQPSEYCFTSQARLDAFLARMGTGGLAAEGTQTTLDELAKLQDGITYSLDFSDGSPVASLREDVRVINGNNKNQANAWESQVNMARHGMIAVE
jgi:hypothetical protein